MSFLTQNGADAHYFDPLTHLYGTMDIYKEIPRIAREIAEQYCEGRWIAVGGGGYDIWRVVPRAWAHIWLAMKNFLRLQVPFPRTGYRRGRSSLPSPSFQHGKTRIPLYDPIPRKDEITEKNAQMLNRALHMIRNEKTNR